MPKSGTYIKWDDDDDDNVEKHTWVFTLHLYSAFLYFITSTSLAKNYVLAVLFYNDENNDWIALQYLSIGQQLLPQTFSNRNSDRYEKSKKKIKFFVRSQSRLSVSKHVQSKRGVTLNQDLFDFVNGLANLSPLYLLIAVWHLSDAGASGSQFGWHFYLINFNCYVCGAGGGGRATQWWLIYAQYQLCFYFSFLLKRVGWIFITRINLFPRSIKIALIYHGNIFTLLMKLHKVRVSNWKCNWMNEIAAKLNTLLGKPGGR